jgi:hypothetical protein
MVNVVTVVSQPIERDIPCAEFQAVDHHDFFRAQRSFSLKN